MAVQGSLCRQDELQPPGQAGSRAKAWTLRLGQPIEEQQITKPDPAVWRLKITLYSMRRY